MVVLSPAIAVHDYVMLSAMIYINCKRVATLSTLQCLEYRNYTYVSIHEYKPYGKRTYTKRMKEQIL